MRNATNIIHGRMYSFNGKNQSRGHVIVERQYCTGSSLGTFTTTMMQPFLLVLHKKFGRRRFRRLEHLGLSLLKKVVLITLTVCFLPALINAELRRELEVSEAVPIGHRIGMIGDFPEGKAVSIPPYLIVPVSASGVESDLAIDLKTGEIRTKLQLDRETRALYQFVAIAKNGEQIEVLIRVLDENDNAPKFPVPILHVEFPENTPRDVKRTLQPARDLDLGANGTQRYNIVSGNLNNAFRLSSHEERDGVLYLDLQINGFLDRETTPEYKLVIEALDGGTPPLRGQMTVNIIILDVNDNQPIFNQSRYFATIPENATVGMTVLQVYASDTDSGENGFVEYAINRRQSDKDEMFRIDPQTGIISVKKPLDFETKELHELVVVAKDHGEQPLETTAFVSIRVTNVNDNQPTINVIFLSDDSTPKISEAAEPGEFVARISVNDLDSKTEYANVNVTLNGGDGHFDLTTQDNIIYLVIVNQTLDREIQPNYTLSVVATDNGTPHLHASKTIYLRVTDINDNAPEFEQNLYETYVMEVADPGTSILRVNAFDRDEGNNSEVIYEIADTPETHARWFQIEPHTGLITTRTHIDCETDPEPRLTVIAKDNGHPSLSSTATVLVTIHDVNDNEPIFDQSFYNVSVAENEPVGRCILKVSASDPDCGVNAVVNFSLDDGYLLFSEFEVRSGTGEICIAGELDYEKRNAYEFPILATDRGGLRTTAMVKIQLTDVNDNRPVFYPREYNVSLRESESRTSTTTPIVSVKATDLDSGTIGTVTYRIVAGNEDSIFHIDRTTGEIFISRPNMLSPRSQPIHVLNISASDGGGLRTSTDAVVYLSIIDSTQTPPIFEKPRYNYNVKENIPRGTVVGAVMAKSGDGVNRGSVRYSIYSGDPDCYFTIDANSGHIRILNPLDRESKAQILLNVQAMIGDPPAYGHAQVNIDIEDVNDNPPEFETSMVRISVPENVELDTPLYAAHAHDKDSGKSGEVTYSLLLLPAETPTNGTFQMWQYHQEQFLTGTFDALNAPSALSTMNSYRAQNVVHPKSSANLYAIRSSPGLRNQQQRHQSLQMQQNLFAIDAISGHITLSQHLDYEINQRHSLIVTATDGGVPPLSSNLTIHVEVQDINDNAPIFERTEYAVRVLESLPLNSQILQVTAIDADTGNNARITYRIANNQHNLTFGNNSSDLKPITSTSLYKDDAQLFGIFPNSGWIYLRGTLDRETRDRYELTVLASDNGTPAAHSHARVNVQVVDTNDNDPHFLQSLYEFTIEENVRRGAFVGVICATDLDLDENAAILYSLIPANTSFQVNAVTGEITTREPLDRELCSLYDLVAEARDQGSPYHSAQVTVKVHVTDVNDNEPYIVDPQDDVVSVREEQPSGTEVVRIRAVDRDKDENATITYSILKDHDSDGYGVFSIDTNTGIIRTCTVLDHEERGIYRLTVAATDGGKPPKQSIRLLRIEVLNLNDNRPTFTSSSLVFRVREDVNVGYVVGSVRPIESDEQVNVLSNSYDDQLLITYHLNSLTEDIIPGAFDINRQTGVLVVARQLDREVQSEFRLEIRSLDMSTSNNPQSSTVTVKIEIADVNDNAPKWSEDPLHIRISELTSVGSIIYNFTATDDDTGSNGDLQYKLLRYTPEEDEQASLPLESKEEKFISNSKRPIFNVDALTGALKLNGALDYENIKEYTLIVQASDKSSNTTERFTTKVTAIVHVLDANDNAPEFVSPEIDNRKPLSSSIQISDAMSIGEKVIHICAIDKDSGENGRISYDIVGGNNAGLFHIHKSSGFIELVKSLPLVTAKEKSIVAMEHKTSSSLNNNNNKHHLLISATDNGAPIPKQTLLNLEIIISGTKSNPPRFLQTVFTASISENVQPGTFVLQVSAKSSNGENGGNLSYEIPANIAHNNFYVDSQRGIITTRGQFDRETKSVYTLPIYVYETSFTTEGRQRRASSASSKNEQHDIATIIINITDVNDNPPEFRPGSCYTLSVPENNDLAVIHTVIATDLDAGANGDVTYSILEGNVGNKFSIDMDTGELTARSLDREQQSRYVLQIQAQDRGTPKTLRGFCNITVNVEDENDNDPRFEQQHYSINIAEDTPVGSKVLHIRARDQDSGDNSRLVYALANETQSLFSIDAESGLITTMGPLDYELQRSFSFMVVATDGGRYVTRSTRVPVHIIIDDVNDNRPIFKSFPFRARVSSLIQPGQALVQVSAIDIDHGMNCEVFYALNISSGGNDRKFRINPNTGVVTASQSLATDSGRVLYINIVARDKGNPAQSSTGMIELTVGEEVIGVPELRFQNQTYRINLHENTAHGTHVLKVSAWRTDGLRQKVSYGFGAGNEESAFVIDSTTGDIKVSNSDALDYEKIYSLLGHVAYRARTLNLDDVKMYQDAANYTDYISSDNLKDRRISRELMSAESTLHTDSSPHEMRFVLTARTESAPLLHAYADFIVQLEDENDNCPRFSQKQYSTSVREGNRKGTFVVQVYAFDIDSGKNSRLLYHIVDGNHDNAFVIEPAFTGIVKTNIVLDREIRDMYMLKVIATDEGVPQLTGTATIRVHVVDVNDNQPTFPPHSVISVNEDTEQGTVITTISANDVDTYPALTYRFGKELPYNQSRRMRRAFNGQTTSNIFAIDKYSGKVILKNRLDYEERQEYQLEIIASDLAHSANTTLTIRVTDKNDNAPIFHFLSNPPAYFVNIPDHTDIGSSSILELLTVNATDKDGEGPNSEVCFNIQSEFPGFYIEETSGKISVNLSVLESYSKMRQLSHEDTFLTIIASDRGVPPKESKTVLRINAGAHIKGQAQFLQTQYRATIRENTALGTVLLRLNKDILDASADYATGNIVFIIIAGNEEGVFEVFQSTSIILVKQLDRERTDLYKLRLVIIDKRASTQQINSYAAENSTAAINIFVTVEDFNDHAPQFMSDVKYEAEISELVPLRYSIAQIYAVDADMENTPQSEVTYEITSGNDEGMFTIDLVTGVLFVNNKLDYDTGSENYQLIIRACDSAVVPLCTLQPFNIMLRDENDNAPNFPVDEYIEYVGENEPIGTSIFTARATDMDRGPFGQLNYSVDHSSHSGNVLDNMSSKLFSINAKTGVVTSNAVFDYEQRHRYHFTLRATDIGGKSAAVKVRILIKSRDEYAPQFTERTYRFLMPSPLSGNVPMGHKVGQVMATDLDKGPDGNVIYQLSSLHTFFKVNRTTGAIFLKKKLDDSFDDGRDISLVVSASSGLQGSLTNMSVVEISLDPLADPGTNLGSSGGRGKASDWALGLLISSILLFCSGAGIFFFIRMRGRKPRNSDKPHLSTETVGTANSYVDTSAFDTIPIRTGMNTNGTGDGNVSAAMAVGQYAPPKYDEVPPYGPHGGSSNSGAATTSELSGSERSGSSGRGSAEDDGEDEEIRLINEGPIHRNGPNNGDDRRISDISVQNTQEYLARLGIIERGGNATAGASTSSHHCSDSVTGSQKELHIHSNPMPMVDSLDIFDEDSAARSDITNLIYAKLNDVSCVSSDRGSNVDDAATTSGSIGVAVDHVIGFGDVSVAGSGNVGPSMSGSLSSIVHSEEELTGSYNWDYLLDWGPQYQPLAHVFSEIARLKDDNISEHSGHSGVSSSTKMKYPLTNSNSIKPHIPPPLLTNIAPRSINMPVLSGDAGSALRLPSNTSQHLVQSAASSSVVCNTGAPHYMLPRSPISHDTSGGFSTSSAMSPSFSPSLSPLATRSPSISPLGSVPTTHHMVSVPGHASQHPKQRGKRIVISEDMRIRM